MAFVSDLLFESKLTATAAAVGVDCRCVRDAAAAEPLVAGASGFLVDMTLDAADIGELIRTLKAARPEATVIAFFPHVRTDLKQAAQAAGADRVLPRSKFAELLPELLKRLAG